MNAGIIFDDWRLAAHAFHALVRAATRSEGASWCHVWLWSLDDLARPLKAQAALCQAVGAHLIVFAVHWQARPPAELLGWLESWADCRELQDAALAFYEGGPEGRGSETAPLEMSRFARDHGLSLIVGGGDLREEPTGLTQKESGAGATVVPELEWTVDMPVQNPYRGYGINE